LIGMPVPRATRVLGTWGNIKLMSVEFQNLNLGLNNLNGVILLMCVLSKTKFIRRVSV